MSRIRWDEDTIAEHDKDRGTRMKIDEPDTPFVRSPEDSPETPNPVSFCIGEENSEKASVTGASVSEECASVGTFIGEAEVSSVGGITTSTGSTLESVQVKKDFAARRKMHYNEARFLKKTKDALSSDDESGSESRKSKT